MYQELSVYLWYILDKLQAEDKIAEDAIVLDIGGGYSEWDWFFMDLNVKRFDAININAKPLDAWPVRELPLDAHNLESFEAQSYDFALSLETLEHLYDPVRAVNEMTRLLKVGAIIFLSGMCAYGYHPGDHLCYWHIYPDGMRYLLREFDIKEIIGYGGSYRDPMGVWAWGSKERKHSEEETAYRHIPDKEVLKGFFVEKGYVYKPGIEMLKDKEGRIVGKSPDMSLEMLERENE